MTEAQWQVLNHRLVNMAEIPLEDALWQRIAAQASRRRRRSVVKRVFWPALAASLLLALVLGLWRQAPGPEGSLKTLIVQSQLLELQLLEHQNKGARVSVGPDYSAALANVDGRINRAYQFNAKTAILQALWAERVALLEHKLGREDRTKGIVRI